MLGQKFSTTDEAVQKMATYLLSHPDFRPRVEALNKLVESTGLVAVDFQFMFNLEAGHLTLTLLDLGEYFVASADARDIWQDMNFVFKNLTESSRGKFNGSDD
jgi:hypothetical protein